MDFMEESIVHNGFAVFFFLLVPIDVVVVALVIGLHFMAFVLVLAALASFRFQI